MELLICLWKHVLWVRLLRTFCLTYSDYLLWKPHIVQWLVLARKVIVLSLVHIWKGHDYNELFLQELERPPHGILNF